MELPRVLLVQIRLFHISLSTIVLHSQRLFWKWRRGLKISLFREKRPSWTRGVKLVPYKVRSGLDVCNKQDLPFQHQWLKSVCPLKSLEYHTEQMDYNIVQCIPSSWFIVFYCSVYPNQFILSYASCFIICFSFILDFFFNYDIQFFFHLGLTCFVVQFVFQSWFIKDLVCCSVCPLMLSTHTPYVCIWLCMKWRNIVHNYMLYTERAETTAVSRGTSHLTTKQCCTYTTSVNIQKAL